jgi:hypothetical protein
LCIKDFLLEVKVSQGDILAEGEVLLKDFLAKGKVSQGDLLAEGRVLLEDLRAEGRVLLEDLLAEGEPKLFTLDPELFGQGGISAIENSHSTCAMR